MTGKQEDQNSRNEVLVGFSKTYMPEILTKESLKKTFDKFLGLHAEVNSKNRIILGGNKGKTLNKTNARNIMGDLAILVGKAVYSIGLEKKDEDLMSRSNVAPSDFVNKMRDTDMITKAKDILSLANLNIADMPGENITPEILLQFEGAIIDFQNCLQVKDMGQKSIQAANEEIDNLLSEISTLIKKEMDTRIYSFKKTNPVMYDEYLLAKKIWTTGVRHEKKEGTTPTV